eukprot:7212852-Alexandrium_andersonii.AAC.1
MASPSGGVIRRGPSSRRCTRWSPRPPRASSPQLPSPAWPRAAAGVTGEPRSRHSEKVLSPAAPTGG